MIYRNEQYKLGALVTIFLVDFTVVQRDIFKSFILKDTKSMPEYINKILLNYNC